MGNGDPSTLVIYAQVLTLSKNHFRIPVETTYIGKTSGVDQFI